jgi:glycine cleavage system H lipoate-binding protein
MVARGDEVVVIESVKAASDILAPVDGEIVEVNDALVDTPRLVNDDPLGAAWFFKIRVDDLSVLDDFMDEDEFYEVDVDDNEELEDLDESKSESEEYYKLFDSHLSEDLDKLY